MMGFVLQADPSPPGNRIQADRFPQAARSEFRTRLVPPARQKAVLRQEGDVFFCEVSLRKLAIKRKGFPENTGRSEYQGIIHLNYTGLRFFVLVLYAHQ